MSSVKRSPKVKNYELLGDFSDSASFKDQIFIYALMLNVAPGVPSLPYYVGQTDNLKVALASNERINWHYFHFGKPAKVLVVGRVDKIHALEAYEDLLARLAERGYWLSNLQIPENSKIDDLPISFEDIRGKQFQEIKQYALSHKRTQNVAQDWKNRWVDPKDELSKDSALPPIRVRKAAKRIRNPKSKEENPISDIIR